MSHNHGDTMPLHPSSAQSYMDEIESVIHAAPSPGTVLSAAAASDTGLHARILLAGPGSCPYEATSPRRLHPISVSVSPVPASVSVPIGAGRFGSPPHTLTEQNAGQNRMKHFIQEAVTNLWNNTNTHKNVVITDLGCSAGPNALTLVKTAVDAILRHCSDHKEMVPEISVLLNDLPDNDFNDVAKRLHAFQQSTQDLGPVVAAIVPGSFYKKLFTRNSVDLVLSSHSLNWLSQVPEDLKKSRIPVYDKDESLRQARRPFVVQAFSQQFRKDFTIFLNTRAKELVPNGQMVLSMVGRPSSDPAYQSIQPWDFSFTPLNDMASRGVISRDMLDSFYIVLYGPSAKELMDIIQDEGSFEINNIEVCEQMSGVDKRLQTPKIRALAARAAFEPTIIQHFGGSEGVMDEFVRTIERQLSLTPASPADSLLFLCVSLTKRD